MKNKFIYLLCFLFFTCDILDQNSLEEFEEEFNYYDYVAYGWMELFNQNYDLSISYFEEALLVSDIDQDGENDYMYNSAYVGLSWALTYNVNYNMTDFNSIENHEFRENAIKYLCYYQDNDGIWNTDGNCENNQLISESDLNASIHYNINENLSGLTFCEQDYCCNDCFINDKQVALIYYYVYKYSYLLIQEGLTISTDEYFNLALSMGLDFLSSTQSNDLLDKNLDYSLIQGKPTNSNMFNITRNNIVALLGQLYLKNENYDSAALIVINGGLCNDILDINNYSVQAIIDCLENL